MLVSIIIVNYNLSNEIENCLNSLLTILNLNKIIEYEIIIVDNNSPDKKLPETENKFQQDNIKFYYLTENVGFGKGCNYGFAKSNGKYLCFLNPDTIVNEDIFSPIISIFAKDNSVGIIGPKQQFRRPFFDFSAGFYPNVFIEMFSIIGVSVFIEAFIVFLLTKLSKKKYLYLDWILGACIVIKADLFKSIDGFDKDYFMFFEEVDLCKRVKNLGYKIVYYPHISIKHIGSVSGKKDYMRYTIRSYVSKILFISKHYDNYYAFILKTLMYLHYLSEVIIWTLLFPFNTIKSIQKLQAFIFLIKNKFKPN